MQRLFVCFINFLMQVFNHHQWNEGNFQVGFFSLVIEVLLVTNFKKVFFFTML